MVRHFESPLARATRRSSREAEELRARRRSAMYQVFSRTNQAIVRSKDEPSLLQAVCDICVATGHALVACAVFRDGEEIRVLGASGPEALLVEAPVVMTEAAKTPNTPTYGAITAGRTTVVNDHSTDPATAKWRELGSRIGVRELAAFPILQGGMPKGSLTIASSEGDYFDRDMVLILTEIAGQVSLAIDNLERERARREAELQTQRSNERFMVALEALPISALIFELDGATVQAVNATFCDLFDMTKEQFIGHSLTDTGIVLPPSNRADIYLPVREGRAVKNLETQIWRRDGRGVTMLVSAQPLEFQSRSSALVTAIDVSEVYEREQRLAGILESTLDPVITIDRQQNIVIYNDAAAETFGYPRQEMMGASLHRLTPKEFLERARRDITAFIDDDLRTQATSAGRYQCVKADGTRIAVGISMSKSGRGPQILVTLVFRDLTAKELAEHLERARKVAELANQAKTAFLSRMSHEFRTPLNAVLGFAQLLESNAVAPSNPKYLNYLGKIQKAGWHLLALTNDVLDVSQIEAGVVKLDWSQLTTSAMLSDVLDLVENQAALVRVELSRVYLMQPDCTINADLLRLRQVLLNLVSNAVKYNRHGGSVVVTSIVLNGYVTMAVQDTGIGMTPDQLGRLFEPYNRLGRERSGIEGTGIGLTIAKQLVELMHGDLRITSEEGVGTLARVTLPLAAIL